MKAIGVFEAGSPEQLRVIDLPDPHPGPGEVIIKNAFAGVNHGDVIRRKRGLFPPNSQPPYVLGFEGAGVVSEAGKETTLKVGERVAFFVESGGYAQLVRVNERQVVRLPESVTLETAAGAICVGATAWHILTLAALKPGSSVVVHGGAGGVGSALLQFGREMELRQLATVGSSEEKAKYARDLGADDVVVRSRENFAERAVEFGGARGVDAIFDCIGAEVVDANLRVLRPGGMLVYYGSTSGHPNFPGGTVLMKSLRIQGFVIFDVMHDEARWSRGTEAVFMALAHKKYRINIERIVPLESAPEAHALLEARQVIGKVIIDMS
jgi:NADPH2:quinone reductase